MRSFQRISRKFCVNHKAALRPPSISRKESLLLGSAFFVTKARPYDSNVSRTHTERISTQKEKREKVHEKKKKKKKAEKSWKNSHNR